MANEKLARILGAVSQASTQVAGQVREERRYQDQLDMNKKQMDMMEQRAAMYKQQVEAQRANVKMQAFKTWDQMVDTAYDRFGDNTEGLKAFLKNRQETMAPILGQAIGKDVMSDSQINYMVKAKDSIKEGRRQSKIIIQRLNANRDNPDYNPDEDFQQLAKISSVLPEGDQTYVNQFTESFSKDMMKRQQYLSKLQSDASQAEQKRNANLGKKFQEESEKGLVKSVAQLPKITNQLQNVDNTLAVLDKVFTGEVMGMEPIQALQRLGISPNSEEAQALKFFENQRSLDAIFKALNEGIGARGVDTKGEQENIKSTVANKKMSVANYKKALTSLRAQLLAKKQETQYQREWLAEGKPMAKYVSPLENKKAYVMPSGQIEFLDEKQAEETNGMTLDEMWATKENEGQFLRFQMPNGQTAVIPSSDKNAIKEAKKLGGQPVR